MTQTNNKEIVLVTGGSGFIALNVIIKLLREGYKVRTTVRKITRKEEILRLLRNSGLAVGDNEIEFYEADLLSDNGWNEAIKGTKYIMHVASPFPATQPKDEDEVIKPAVEGTLRILKIARDDGNVKRVILTSSFAAIGYSKGSENIGRPLTENDWTIIDETTAPYVKSKVLAERAAWEFIKNQVDTNLELSVINPTGVFGPVLNDGNDYINNYNNLSTSIQFVKYIIDNVFSNGYPQFDFGVVDVRDVAEIHYLAMIKDEAKNQRFLATNKGFVNLEYIGKLLKERVPELSQTLTLPTPQNLEIKIDATNEKAKSLLNWNPINTDDAIISTAKSLINLN